jgi:hypothetical protein
VRALVLASLLLLSACTAAVRIPREPFPDIPVPAGWVPYSQESVITETPAVTTARLVYFSRTSVDASLDQARALLVGSGWKEARSERFVNPEKFPGVWAEFHKDGDTCRVTAIEGAQATHVDYAVARLTSSR